MRKLKIILSLMAADLFYGRRIRRVRRLAIKTARTQGGCACDYITSAARHLYPHDDDGVLIEAAFGCGDGWQCDCHQ